MSVVLDANGNPISAAPRVVVDENGNPISAAPPVSSPGGPAPDPRSAGQLAMDLTKHAVSTGLKALSADPNKSLADNLAPMVPMVEHPWDTVKNAASGAVNLLKNAPSDLGTVWDTISKNRNALNEAKGITPPGSAAPAATDQENQRGVEAATRMLSAGALAGSLGDSLWSATMPRLASQIQTYGTAPTLNALMDIRPTELQFGRNPGARIASDGIMAATKPSLLLKMQDVQEGLGAKLEGDLANASGAGTVDGESAIKQSMDEARRRPGFSSDKAFQSKLDDIQSQAVDYAKNELGAKDMNNLSPLQAQRLKSYLYDGIKWNGTAYEGDVNQAMAGAAQNLNNSLQSLVPGSADTLARYGDYQVGINGLKRSIARDAAGQGSMMNPANYTAPSTLASSLTSSKLPLQPDAMTGMDFSKPVIPKGRLLGTGTPQLPETGTEAPYAPGYRSNTTSLQDATLAPATREIRTGRLLKAGTPLPEPTELPSGGFSMNVETGPPLQLPGPESGGSTFGEALKRAATNGAQIQGDVPIDITDPQTGAKIPFYITDPQTGAKIPLLFKKVKP